RLEQATEEFRRAVELGDNDPNTQLKLGKALMLQGDRDAAKLAVDESMRLDPERKQLAKAFELEKTGNEAEAERIYREIITRDPENVEALRLLAGMATSQNQHRDAEVLLKRALELAPDFGRALADLVINQIEQEKIEDALAHGKRLIRIGTDNPDSYLLMGNAYAAAGRYSDAIDAYKKSLRMAPDHPGALSGLAHNLKTLGHQDEAIATYRKCIKSNPLYTETYWSLANLKTFRFTDEEVRSMEELLRHPDIPDDAQVHLCNALGLEHEGRDNFDQAFDYFQKCNTIKRTKEYYDPVETEMLHDGIIEVFDRDFIAQNGADRHFCTSPIFIIGLPRSGSTLLEQILASHSAVEGTHELSDLGRIIHEIPKMFKKRARFPRSLMGVDSEGFGRLGHAYLDRTSKYRSGKHFFTDKNPNNFAHVGLIHLILPNAIIINALRHPLDSCLGSFKQLFAKGQPFSYDLTDLAEFYLQYYRMMDHWNEVLPGKVLDVQYEDVVRDLETQVHRILEHCGLPFEEQCLRFHETDRAVKTASSEQVRQPIYSSSVNLWRKYEKHLEPTIDILAPILRTLPEADRPHTVHAD
ncbi:MAG: sulfotransferase, partial [Acidiferrobacterales bacterium]